MLSFLFFLLKISALALMGAASFYVRRGGHKRYSDSRIKLLKILILICNL